MGNGDRFRRKFSNQTLESVDLETTRTPPRQRIQYPPVGTYTIRDRSHVYIALYYSRVMTVSRANVTIYTNHMVYRAYVRI